MIMLVFCIIGWRLLVKKAEMPAPKAKAPQQIPEEISRHIPRQAPQGTSIIFPDDDPGPFGQSRLTMRIPDPVEVKEKAPKTPARRPCMPVAMPETVSRRSGV
jgi:hypothetical protein